MSDCRYGVSPVNYPDPGENASKSFFFCFFFFFVFFFLFLLALLTLLMMTSVFVIAPECLYAKPHSRVIALLIHGFVPDKSWLLIACDTAFYAVIFISRFIL